MWLLILSSFSFLYLPYYYDSVFNWVSTYLYLLNALIQITVIHTLHIAVNVQSYILCYYNDCMNFVKTFYFVHCCFLLYILFVFWWKLNRNRVLICRFIFCKIEYLFIDLMVAQPFVFVNMKTKNFTLHSKVYNLNKFCLIKFDRLPVFSLDIKIWNLYCKDEISTLRQKVNCAYSTLNFGHFERSREV